MKKKIFLLSALLALIFSLPAMAEENVWEYDELNSCLVANGELSGDVQIPGEVNGYTVSFLSSDAVGGQNGITSLTMPDSVTALKGWSISSMEGLASIQLSENLAVIQSANFSNCPALTSVTVPASVCYVDSSFYWCDNLREIRFEGVCPVFMGNEWNFSGLPEDCVIYVPDDQLEAYAEALADANGAADRLQPGGQNAVNVEYTAQEEDFAFDAATGTITGYSGTSARLEIPETIGSTPVKAIGEESFRSCYTLFYLIIPEGVETIEDRAFAHASNLNYITFPSTLRTVGEEAFLNAQASVINWKEGLEEIGAYAFSYDYEAVLTLPSTVRTIGEGAFKGSMCSELYLSGDLESIGSCAFAGSSISYMAFDFYEPVEIAEDAFADTPVADLDLPWDSSEENREAYEAMLAKQCPGCTVWINNPITGGVAEYPVNDLDITTITDGVWTVYNGDAADLTVWTDYDGIPLTALGDGLFRGNQSIRSFYPHHCGWFTTIGSEAFADSSVEYVELFGSITTIGEGAFRNCTNIKELTIPASVTSIGADAFAGCSGLEKLTILCDASVLQEGAFSGCANLKEVTVMKGAIPASCFADSGLTTVSLGEEVTAIGDSAFANTALTEISLGEEVTVIGDGAFANTGLTEISLGEEVTVIGNGAFAGTQISRLVIPANAQVNEAAVEGISLENIRISDSATDEQVAAWSEALNFPWYDRLIRVSEESVFVKMPYVSTPEEYFEFDASTGTITEYTGSDIDVVIPRTIDGVEVKTIGYGTFSCAEDYTDTEMDTNQTEWLHLRSVVIPETVTSIEDSVFNYCQQLETVICYGPLETTGRGTFMRCRNLKNVVFVNGVRALDNYLFSGCESLRNVWYKGETDLIGEECFQFSGIESLVIRAKQVGVNAFRYCTGLKEIHVRSGIESFSISALLGCTSLSDICFEFTSPEIFEEGEIYSGDCAPGAVMTIPSSAIEEEMAEFYRIWKKSNLGPIEDESHIVRQDCEVPDQEMPDVNALMAAYDVNYDGSAELPEAPAAPLETESEAFAVPAETESEAFVAPLETESEVAAVSGGTDATDTTDEPEMVSEPEDAEVSGAAPEACLERKYICTTADVSGFTMDASSLGSEYSVIFHGDGTAEFILSGQVVPGLTWTMEKVETDNGEADAFVIIYFDGTPLNFVITESGFDLDFFGSMLMHLEPEA